MHISNVFKKTMAVLLALSFVVVPVNVQPAQAEVSESVAEYLNSCYHSIRDINTLNPCPKVIAQAYLVGEDDMATASWSDKAMSHPVYAVEPGTEIQGVRYNPSLYPQDTFEYLKDVKERYGVEGQPTYPPSMPEGGQYLELEGCKWQVVAVDDEWVTFWDRGHQSWDVWMAEKSNYVQITRGFWWTHPAGFYRIQRNKVWLDFSLAGNHPYQSEAEIPKAGSGVVTKLVYLRPVPNEAEKTYTPVYALPMGTEVNVVSTKLVPSEAPGSTNKYYKVSFNGSDKVQNNTVLYLAYKVPGVYYIDSRYLNVTPKGTQLEGTSLGEVINVKQGDSVYVYQSKDTGSKRLGILSLGAKIEMYPAESDTAWTTVYFSGQKAYVQSQYIKKTLYKVKDITKPYIADIVDEKFVMKWNVGENNIEYSVSIKRSRGKGKGKVLWSDKHYKKNSVVIKRKFIENNEGLCVTVQATDKNGNKGKELSRYITMPRQSVKLRTTAKRGNKKRSLLTVGRKKIAGSRGYERLGVSIQYSTNKSFKKAVTVEKYNKKSGYGTIRAITKLKPNTTYYIRRRTKAKYKTTAGVKWLSGKWSKSVKVKTKA